MIRTQSIHQHFYYTVFLGLLFACLVLCIILFPEQSFDASLQSLTIWWTIVFPALLPFYIIAEILLAYGILHFCGGMLEPGMRYLFRLPGVSGPVMAISLLIGYPFGSKLTKQLYDNQSLTRAESELLLSLSHIASPLLVINVIAVGFFQYAPYGIMLYFIQLTALLLIGFIMKWSLPRPQNQHNNTIVQRAIALMRVAQRNDGRTFGKLLGDAVSTSIQTLLMVGGYMMIFAVIIQVLASTQLTVYLQQLLGAVISFEFTAALMQGMFEVHLGSFALSHMQNYNLPWLMATLSALLAWSGWSLHAQVSHQFAATSVRYSRFLTFRLLQAGTAFVLTLCLWSPLSRWIDQAMPSFLNFGQHSTEHNFSIVSYLLTVPIFIVLLILCMTVFSYAISVINSKVR